MRKVVQEVSAASPPIGVSLVGKPAVRSGFRITRAEGTTPVRTSNGQDSISAVSFPAGTSEEAIKSTIDGLQLGVSLTRQEDDENGGITYTKSNTGVPEGTTSINMRNDTAEFTLHLSLASPVTRSDSSITGVTLYALNFPDDKSVEEVEKWLSDKGIQYLSERSESSDGVHKVVLRSDMPKDAELKPIQVEENVTGLVYRSEDNDVPESIANTVIESAYGGYGWGILDFNQYMANKEFRDGFHEAMCGFRCVMESILIDSEVSVAERATMAQNALNAFSAYITAMLAVLPKSGAQMIQTSEGKRMALSNKAVPAVVTPTASTNVTKRAESEQQATIQGSEIVAAISASLAPLQEGLATAISAALSEIVKRSEENSAKNAEQLQAKLVEVQAAVQELGSTVVLRQEPSTHTASTKRDVFDGMLFGNR